MTEPGTVEWLNERYAAQIAEIKAPLEAEIAGLKIKLMQRIDNIVPFDITQSVVDKNFQLEARIADLEGKLVAIESERDTQQTIIESLRRVISSQNLIVARLESRLRETFSDPPPDLQEKVIKMLDLVSRDTIAAARDEALEQSALILLDPGMREKYVAMGPRCLMYCVNVIRALKAKR